MSGGFWDTTTGGQAFSTDALVRLFDDIKAGKMDAKCLRTGEHVLLDYGPTADICQCGECGAFSPRPGGPRKPGARQWEDRR